MALAERVRHADFLSRSMTAEQAAQHVAHGATVGLSGFTGAGYPKALPQAIAATSPMPIVRWTACRPVAKKYNM